MRHASSLTEEAEEERVEGGEGRGGGVAACV